MSRLSASILIAIVAVALVASCAEASITNPTGPQIKAFFNRNKNLKKGLLAAMNTEKNGKPLASGRRLLSCSTGCNFCWYYPVPVVSSNGTITYENQKECECMC